MTLVSHHLSPELHRIVVDVAPRIGVVDKAQTVSRRVTHLIESALREHSNEIASEIDLAAAATVIETVLEALAHRVMLARPAQLQDDTLTKEATRLITHYLIQQRPRS